MCGIAGFIAPDLGLKKTELEASAQAMTDRIIHRGPDGAGVWSDSSHGVVLGHRRLSIRDLSEQGSQPMVSANGRWVLVYNGELYDTDGLISRLESHGVVLRSQSDTEVLLESIACFGIEETLDAVNGMFAFAVWDKKKRELYLARDRMGIKPLYWAKQGSRFYFASELKALVEAPGWVSQVEPAALSAYFQCAYIPAPLSIYKDTYKLEQGHWIAVRGVHQIEKSQYWSLYQASVHGMNNPLDCSIEEADEIFTSLLDGAVKNRMVSDVPIGSFLSGGIDSSVVTAFMQANSDKPVHSFSLGFDEKRFDESSHARAVANHLGTEHTELMVTGKDALAVIPSLCEHHDEPLADTSQIPTYLVSKLARPHVTVALTGDGGDELFCGYDRFLQAEFVQKMRQRIGPFGCRTLETFVKGFMGTGLPGLMNKLPGPTYSRLHQERWAAISGALCSNDDIASYEEMIAFHHNLHDVIKTPANYSFSSPDWKSMGGPDQTVNRTQFVDQKMYLPDVLLAKVDRASMQSSLEARVPFLDHRVVELSARLPREFRANTDNGKLILRRILSRYVPTELFDRPKMGFSVPGAEWLNDDLRDWASDLLTTKSLQATGEWNIPKIQKRWKEHCSGSHRWHLQIWQILLYQNWAQHWGVQ